MTNKPTSTPYTVSGDVSKLRFTTSVSAASGDGSEFWIWVLSLCMSVKMGGIKGGSEDGVKEKPPLVSDGFFIYLSIV